jgi:hypothetical protein
MISFDAYNFMIDWTNVMFQVAVFSFTYPFNGVFRTDSLFALVWNEGEWYLEIFFFTVIGEKKYEE